MVAGWNPPVGSTFPSPPKNVTITSPFVKGVLDVRWDDPTTQSINTAWEILGVNVYRSDASDRGPYRRLNQYPLGTTFFRDFTDLVLITNEVVHWGSSWVSRGDSSNVGAWIFRTQRPIYKRGTVGDYGNSPTDVTLFVGGVEVPVHSVFGPNGEVQLVDIAEVDPASQRLVGPYLPSETTEVRVSYYTLGNLVSPGVDKKAWYRITSVALDPTVPGSLRETPLEHCPPAGSLEVESLDYIWREAIRRNQWILEQGGERAKVFVQKVMGQRCFCDGFVDPHSLEYGKQPHGRCTTCFGVGIVDPYVGPYDVIMAPDDAEKRISQSQTGRRKEHTYEVWMGPSPMVSQRDFIVKQNNDRYSIGPVRRPTNRGNNLQQHFQIGYLDSADIRYQVPVDGYENIQWPGVRYTYYPWRLPRDVREDAPWPVTADANVPMGTNHPGIPASRQERGRTPSWQNQMF